MAVDEFAGMRPDLEGIISEELRHLIERSYQIEQMTTHPGWPFYRDYLISLTATVQTLVLDGRCKTIEDYREKTGFVKGLRTAVDAPEMLLRRVSELQALAEENG